MLRLIISLFFLVLALADNYAQVAPTAAPKIILVKEAEFKQLAALPKSLDEASGLITYHAGQLWSHNDDGLPVLYKIDTAGNKISTVYLNHKNSGWEDLAKDKQGNLYIGDFGNNKNSRKNLRIIKIENPENISGIFTGDIISYTYEDQQEYPPPPEGRNYDVDAFISLGDSLYLFTKNRTSPYNGIINVYSLPATPGSYIARKTDSFKLPGNKISNWVTGADITENEERIALLFHDKVIIIDNFANSRFSSGTFYQISLDHYSNKGGISFSDDKLYIVDEVEMNILGGFLYQLTYRLK